MRNFYIGLLSLLLPTLVFAQIGGGSIGGSIGGSTAQVFSVSSDGTYIIPTQTSGGVTRDVGATADRIPNGYFTNLDTTTLTIAGAVTGDLHVNDDAEVTFGNTYAAPDVRMGWNTAQTVDALYLGLSTAQNTFVIGELGDIAFDFAHGAQTNPTVFIHSAAQNTTQWLSLAHDQTNAVFGVGAGGLTLPNNVGIGIAPGADTALMVGDAAVNDSTRLTVIAHTRTDTGNVTPIANYIRSVANPAGASSASFNAQFVISQTATGLAQNVSGIVGANFAAQSNLNAANTTSFATGFLGQASNVGGTTTTARGAWLAIINTSGTITTSQGAFIASPSILAGSIGTAYGLYVDNITGATTANYGAYIVGGSTAALAIVQAAVAGGSPAALTITGGAHTALAAATEDIGANFNFSATKTWAAGAGPLAAQRELVIQAPTYAGDAGGALTISRADTVSITGAPIAGANITLTEANALYVGGQMRLDSQLQWGAGVAVTAGQYSVGRNADATNRLQFNVPTGAIHEFSVNDIFALTVGSSSMILTQAAVNADTPTAFTITAGAHTASVPSAELTDVFFNLTRTVQFGTGALTTQRAMQIGQPTYGFVDASTLSNAMTVEIAGPPRAGANATITTSRALAIGGGSSNPVDTVNVTMAEINMPDIADGVGAMTNLIGLQLTSGGVQLGNQTATLNFFAGVHLLGVTLTSDTLVRTVTTAATLRVAGPPVASSNVVISGPSRAVNIGGGAVTTGTAQELLVSTGAHTGMTLSTEASGISFDLSATKQWATGDITNQREFRIQAPTYDFVEASTIAVASTIWVNRPPWAGTNATLTSAASFRMGVATASANAGTSSHLFLYPLAIRNGYGLMTTLAGLIYSDGGAGVSLGNVTNTLTNLNAIRLDAITYTSTTLVRTVTNPATLYIGGAPVAGGNVTFANTGLALHVDANISRFDGGIDLDADGVRITEDSDGAITFLGLGNGSDEDLTINLDDTANTIALSSSTGVTDVRWDTGTGVGQFTLDGSTGGCIMLRDTDDAGWTEIDALDGVLTASIDADGQCD